MMELYHGSYMAVPHPLVDVGRDKLDFGKGFYLTNIREQAEKWAGAVYTRYVNSQPTVSVYDFDLDAALAEGCRYLCMPAYDMQWLEFVVASRIGQRPWLGYDVIEGGIANDRVVDTVEDYMRQILTADLALQRLIYEKPTHQLCILAQDVADRHLTFKESYTI